MARTTWGVPPRAARPERPRITAVIPTYNEAANLPALFEALPDAISELLIVDGWSTDGTVEVATAMRPDARIIKQTRRGKGNALACGFNNASGDIVVMLDADLSTDPREIPRYVDTLLDGADYAKGSRFAAGGTSHDITPVRKLGNVFLNTTVNVLYRTRYTDLCYGYNAFWRDVLPVLGMDCGEEALDMRWGDGFEIETILNVRAAKAGLRIVEVPSVEQPRLHGESKLNAVRDGLRILRVIATEYARTPVYSADPATQLAGDAAWQPEGVVDPDLHGAPMGQREPEADGASHLEPAQERERRP
jgi:glycosyltransferase involved in cell wall biosynthesis